MMSNVCSIYFFEGWLNVSPTVINLAKSLSDFGYEVTIYTRDTGYTRLDNLDERIRVVYFKPSSIVLKAINFFLRRVKQNLLITIVEAVFFWLQILFYKISHFQYRETLSIGVDTNGSTAALIQSWLSRSKLVYLSLEMTCENYLEHLAYRTSECVLIQDEDRYKILHKFNNQYEKVVFYIPNSITSGNFLAETGTSQNYFRELFNLSHEDYPYIVLQAGWIDDTFRSKEAVTAFSNISGGFALILHERQKRDLSDFYIRSLKEINSKNLFLSLNPLPYEEVDRVYHAATVGLAFYGHFSEHHSSIALASGKLSGYLKHGKPVLMSSQESLSKLNQKYNFGVIVQNLSDSLEVENALTKILNNYDFYQQNALNCYQQEFDFKTKSKPFIDFISSLASKL